jgi:transposase-like protein
MSVIPNASGESLLGFIGENVAPSSCVITDGWSGYSSLEANGYTHTVYKQSKAKTEDELLPHVHLVISLLKRWLLGTHQGAISAKHLQAYLDEFVFRFNRRTSAKRGLLFYRLLETAMVTPPATYSEITK